MLISLGTWITGWMFRNARDWRNFLNTLAYQHHHSLSDDLSAVGMGPDLIWVGSRPLGLSMKSSIPAIRRISGREDPHSPAIEYLHLFQLYITPVIHPEIIVM